MIMKIVMKSIESKIKVVKRSCRTFGLARIHIGNGSLNKFGEDGKKRGDEKEAGICTMREGITFAVQLGGRLRTSSLVILLFTFLSGSTPRSTG